MANQGASLQNYNTELIKMLENIKESRQEVQSEISQEEAERDQIQAEMNRLGHRLEELRVSLDEKYKTRSDFDKTIGETENAFVKILESS